MGKKKRIIIVKQIIYGTIFAILLGTLVFVIVKMFLASANPDVPYEKSKVDYSFILIMSILGVAGTFVPLICDRKFKFVLPTGLEIMFLLFLFGSVYLGEVLYFYYRIPIWDDILHAMSGAMFAIMSFSVVSLLNKKHFVDLNPLFISIFAFCFAITLGVFWEMIEFSIDAIGGFNMQKWATESGDALVGRAALIDTMVDLIIDGVGALVISIIGYLSLKGKKEIINSFLITTKKDTLKEMEDKIREETKSVETKENEVEEE